MLLVETVRKSGLDQATSTALAPWRKSRAVHDPGKTVLDLALAVALGGDPEDNTIGAVATLSKVLTEQAGRAGTDAQQ